MYKKNNLIFVLSIMALSMLTACKKKTDSLTTVAQKSESMEVITVGKNQQKARVSGTHPTVITWEETDLK